MKENQSINKENELVWKMEFIVMQKILNSMSNIVCIEKVVWKLSLILKKESMERISWKYKFCEYICSKSKIISNNGK